MAKNNIEILELKQFANFLTPRPRDANKGHFGHVVVVGGDYGFSGAVLLAAKAALRVGAGLVSVVTQPEHAVILNVNCPEIMCHSAKNINDVKIILDKANVIVAGPGLGTTTWAQNLLKLILKSEKNLVIDADGLNLLAKNPIYKMNWILTPHPGEAARLLQTSVQEIQSDRLAALKLLQTKLGGVTVLKGSGSLVMGHDGIPTLCKAGNPGMATAGMGDVLSGVIAGLMAQGIPLTESAKLGALIHAMAGDLAAEEGERGMIASDLFPFLRKLVN